jgi:uncharacterized protein
MDFEWDAAKAERNQRKHKVALAEASTVFGDPLAVTFPDPDHSVDEYRFLTFGMSRAGRLLVVSHAERQGRVRIIGARQATGRERKDLMKMARKDEMRAEYVREDLGEGIRGRYYERYQEGTNLILLDPDVAAAFPASESVNQALRSLIEVARRSTGGRKPSAGAKRRG